MAAYTSASAGPTTVAEERYMTHPAIAQPTYAAQPAVYTATTVEKAASPVNANRMDPHDEWSSRDLLLSCMPFVIAICFRNIALQGGLLVAAVLAFYLLFKRMGIWGGIWKRQWPVFDLFSFVLFIVLFSCSWPSVEENEIEQWLLVIAGGTFALMALASLAVRRPFTSHHGRYESFDYGGNNLWETDMEWRAVNDRSTLTWALIFTLICLLSLAPALAHYHGGNQWRGYTGLNIFFNYVWPLGLMALALVSTQGLGRMYARNYLGNGPTTTMTTTTAQPVATAV